MSTEGKSDRDLLVELHTHILGTNGVMDRVKVIEAKVEDVENFKTKWMTIASILVVLFTLLTGVVKEWVVSFLKGGKS